MTWAIPNGRRVVWERVVTTAHGILGVRVYDDKTTDARLEDVPIEQTTMLMEAPAPKQGCKGCSVPVHRWLLIRWYGYPMPLRWWRKRRLGIEVDERGCGCIVKLKAATIAVRMMWNTTRRAASMWWKA